MFSKNIPVCSSANVFSRNKKLFSVPAVDLFNTVCVNVEMKVHIDALNAVLTAEFPLHSAQCSYSKEGRLAERSSS